MVQKLHIRETVYFGQLLCFQILLLLFLHALLICHILLFGYWIFSLPSRCQTVWIQIRPNILSGLICVQNVCKFYQQTTKLATSGQRVKYKTTFDITFWLKPGLKLISLAPTFSIWLKCWLQQILSQGKPCIDEGSGQMQFFWVQ